MTARQVCEGCGEYKDDCNCVVAELERNLFAQAERADKAERERDAALSQVAAIQELLLRLRAYNIGWSKHLGSLRADIDRAINTDTGKALRDRLTKAELTRLADQMAKSEAASLLLESVRKPDGLVVTGGMSQSEYDERKRVWLELHAAKAEPEVAK